MDYPKLEKYLSVLKMKLISLIQNKFDGTLELRINFKQGGIVNINAGVHDVIEVK